MSHWALATSYFFHLIATIVWIGGLALLVMVVWPAARQVYGGDPRLAELLGNIRRRFSRLANLSLVVLIVTGMLQMTGDPNYDGVLTFDNDWSRAMLAKHIAIVGMVLVGMILQWGIAPAQERFAILLAKGREASPDEIEQLARRERQLNVINLVLGVLVLAFTALATAL